MSVILRLFCFAQLAAIVAASINVDLVTDYDELEAFSEARRELSMSFPIASPTKKPINPVSPVKKPTSSPVVSPVIAPAPVAPTSTCGQVCLTEDSCKEPCGTCALLLGGTFKTCRPPFQTGNPTKKPIRAPSKGVTKPTKNPTKKPIHAPSKGSKQPKSKR